jgi:hypothetical protein
MTGKTPILQVIACPVFQRELELLAAEARTTLTFRHLDMGLHEGAGVELRAALQASIDGVPPGQCDAIAIAYGLCNRGIVGLRARSVPVVIPRAHDCIGMLLGGTQAYLQQLESQPGTYFQSGGDLRPQMSFGPGSNLRREELAAKYGEENADYLLEQFAKFTQHYERLAFIATPVPGAAQREEEARQSAQARGWKFERLPGDLGWLRRLLGGEWNEREFLTLQPGERVALRTDELLIGAEAAS